MLLPTAKEDRVLTGARESLLRVGSRKGYIIYEDAPTGVLHARDYRDGARARFIFAAPDVFEKENQLFLLLLLV